MLAKVVAALVPAWYGCSMLRTIARRVLCISVIGLTAVGLLSPASAGDKPVLRIELDSADSVCIGDTSTPSCAVETWRACFVRRDPELCGKVVTNLVMWFDPTDEPYFVEYQISDVLRLGPEQITPKLAGLRVEAGDLEVRIRLRACRYGDAECGYYSPAKMTYFLKSQKSRWNIVAWSHQYAPETCEPYEPGGKRMRDCQIFIYEASLPWVHDPNVGWNWE